MSAHGSELDESACRKCEGGKCRACKTLLRMFRMAVRRGMAQPGFARAMLATGEVTSGERIVEGGLPLAQEAESLLMRTARAIQGERRASKSPKKGRS